MLVAYNAVYVQKQQDSADIMALRVGLKIRRAETELMMVGNWSSSLNWNY
jgi:hypothetical protein